MDFADCRCALVALGVISLSAPARADGDAAKGETYFNGGTYRCYTCHSLKPGEHKIGPSLARLFGRRAGSAEGYTRYSEAMMNSGVVWNAETLDQFLASPRDFIPGNAMIQEGYFQSGKISSAALRADVIAYLERATAQ